MRTAPILRQAPIAPASRLVGSTRAVPRQAASMQEAAPARPDEARTDEMPASPAPVAALSEAEIQQRGLALAQRMVQAEAEQARKTAREEGLRAGREEGLAQARAQAEEGRQAQQARFQDVMDALLEALRREQEATLDAALALALAALVRILGVRPDTERVMALVRQASSQLRHPGQVRVKLAPADLALLKEAGIDPAALAPQAAEVMWVADATIQGGCVLQTEAGNLDARLQRQVAALGEALSQAYRAHEATP